MQIRDHKKIRQMANAIRSLSIDAIAKANSGHPGMPLGFADVATVLFTEYLKFNSQEPDWSDRDRFILSAGHGSMLLYSLLHLTGYEDATLEEIKNFRQLHSLTAGHPEYGYLAGTETTTGPLGQGIANAVGMALAERMMNERFGDKLVNHKTYCVVGDGCLMEGVSYEALSLAGHLNLHNLIILWDNNEITIDGKTDLTRTEDMKKRFESIGFEYIEANGHQIDEIRAALFKAKISLKPSFISFKTKIGYGSPKVGSNSCHGSPIKGDDLIATKKELKIDYPAFEIPEEILNEWNKIGLQGENEFNSWVERLEETDEEKQSEFLRLIEGELPLDWKDGLRKFEQEVFLEKPCEATRKSSGRVLEILTENIPEIIGGSADVTGSIKSRTKATSEDIKKYNYKGRYINYGIREHAMTAIMNGLALHGEFIPYSGTFLCFVDYMKPAIRLAAMMELQVIYILTHDSIGLGEDGPTHQPIEHIASLRTIPNLNVFRPADIQETIECYELALESKNTPTAMILSRQNLPFLASEYNSENYSAKGAYIYSDTALNIEPDVVIIATGSEVDLAINVKNKLHENGLAVRVVSAPCLEIFDKQDKEYRKSVLGGDKVLKVAIEAACDTGWHKYIGDNGLFCGIVDSFGLSAPADQVYKEFGLDVDSISKKIVDSLKK